MTIWVIIECMSRIVQLAVRRSRWCYSCTQPGQQQRPATVHVCEGCTRRQTESACTQSLMYQCPVVPPRLWHLHLIRHGQDSQDLGH
jgi:hypothetical protein